MDVESPTVPALLRHRAIHSPDLSALVHDDQTISYRELDERSRALAARLVAAGVGKRSRVGVLMRTASTGRRWPTRPSGSGPSSSRSAPC